MCDPISPDPDVAALRQKSRLKKDAFQARTQSDPSHRPCPYAVGQRVVYRPSRRGLDLDVMTPDAEAGAGPAVLGRCDRKRSVRGARGL